jgi:hypothetical protein
MISFNNLGNLGRLGNQMFQYAAIKGIAANRGFGYCIPPKNFFGTYDENVKKSDVSLYDVFGNIINGRNYFTIQSLNSPVCEAHHHFDYNLFNRVRDKSDLFGYFQSEKYFKHIEQEIRNDFTFCSALNEECNTFWSEAFGTEEVISLHLRRGDYVTNSNHPVQPIQYYEQALNSMPPNIPVIVFSDDSDWCKGSELFQNDRFFISENNTTDTDLCLMSKCNYHIIANSSFSWWGAWLAQSESVIAPRNWFGGSCSGHNIEDYRFNNFKFL